MRTASGEFFFRPAEPPNRHRTPQLLRRCLENFHRRTLRLRAGERMNHGKRSRRFRADDSRITGNLTRPTRAPEPSRNRPRGTYHPAAPAGTGTAAPSWLRTRENPAGSRRTTKYFVEAGEPLPRRHRHASWPSRSSPAEPIDRARSANRASGTFCSAHQTSVYWPGSANASSAGRLTMKSPIAPGLIRSRLDINVESKQLPQANHQL